MPRTRSFALQLGFAAILASPAAAQWSVTNLDPGGTTDSTANAAGGGQQVGYARVGPTMGHTRASLWTGSPGSWVNLQAPGVIYSIAYATDGVQQVGESVLTGLPRACLWSGTAASWVDLHPPGASASIAWAVDAGQQVGSADVFGPHALLWTGSAASSTDLNPPPVAGIFRASEAFAVHAGRQGGYVTDVDGVIGAAVWSGTAASWVKLHPPGMISSWVYGLDATQQVGVVRVPDTSSHAALWTGTPASWVDLHPPGVLNSRASDVSAGRQVGYTVSNGVRRAAMWTGTAASHSDLHAFLPAAFSSSEATGIWINGPTIQVAGWGFNGLTNRGEALLWTYCYSDCDGDAALTLADFGCFQTAFGLGAAYADCDGDGAVTLADFGCFQTAFGLGCP